MKHPRSTLLVASMALSLGFTSESWADIPPHPAPQAQEQGVGAAAADLPGVASSGASREEAPAADPADSAPPEATLAAPAPPLPPPPTGVEVVNPERGGADGLTLEVHWTPSSADAVAKKTPGENPVFGYAVFRADSLKGPYKQVGDLPAGTNVYKEKVANPEEAAPLDAYYYVVAVQTPELRGEATLGQSLAAAPAEGRPQGSWFNVGSYNLLLLILLFGGMVFYYTAQMQKGAKFFIRRIPGIDAIEEAIGRATEMGKPILYVPGIDELQDIQTIASMLILGRVAEIVANYESEMIVPCTYPMVREVADEVVRAGYFMAGRPDSYDARSVRFISSEQFAFCAGTNGIILRQKPAANLYLGRFFAESLLFAETGFVNRSIQIAGTAEPTQLPFFIVSCDYTIIGEELFAVSAYLSHDPRLVSSLRASDVIKAIVIAAILIGTALSSFGVEGFAMWWTSGN